MTDEHLPKEQDQTPDRAPVFATKRGMWSRGSGDTSGYGGMVRELSMPGRARPPFDDPDADAIHAAALDTVDGFGEFPVLFDRGELTIYVPRERLPEVVRRFRDDAELRFEVCVSVSGVHYPQDAGAELHAVYHLLSITHNRRVRLEVTCPDEDPHIPSVVATYPHTDYHERETWDMFGIIFDGHPALTRILMPDDWHGHPQRKDYPLGGIDVEYKGATVPSPDNRRSYS
ncbi:NADH-quinone oxidoreductase subunit C [uncultured Tessaracoccus sp.]|uniref:NADH-quinone oxidoreductase subunit C n=1 Tax=uncultured Tessaracoccus sp. TaxID=905023 RepID=UPI0025DEDAA3|nr:NADH-quinone oxidoreductase subunit C [uncultured Tessaracoccus sp.]